MARRRVKERETETHTRCTREVELRNKQRYVFIHGGKKIKHKDLKHYAMHVIRME